MAPQRSPRLWSLSEAIEVVIVVAAIAAVSLGWATFASAQDTPLDLTILAKLDAPTAAPTQAGSTLNLSILDRLDTSAATSPVDTLDITLLNALDSKPAIKPSKSAMRSLGTASGVDLGDEIGREACKPERPQASVNGVNPRDTTVNPPNGRIWERPDDERQALIEHLIGHPNHSSHGFTFDALNRLDLSILERLHSNDHDGRLNLSMKTIAEAPRPSAVTCPDGVCPVPASTGKQTGTKPTAGTTSPPSWGNVTSFGWLDGSWRSTPQPGTNYPTLGGILVPLSGGVVSAPQAPRQQTYVRGNCPGGVCPLN